MLIGDTQLRLAESASNRSFWRGACKISDLKISGDMIEVEEKMLSRRGENLNAVRAEEEKHKE